MSPYVSNVASAVIKIKVLIVFVKQKIDTSFVQCFFPFLQQYIDEYFKIQTYREYVIKVKKRK